MTSLETTRSGASGRLLDDHDLSVRARAYGESIVCGQRWSLSTVDLSKIAWMTSSRMRRKNGSCSYQPDGQCTIRIGEHVYDRAGFHACREVLRHELVHAWQHQHRNEWATIDDTGATFTDESTPDSVRIQPGHGPSFRAWVGPLALSGRCSTPYERTRGDYSYVLECPSCGDWWGKHRLCKSVRQAAHGPIGPAGYRYCTGCETLVFLRAGDRYLDYGDHSDETIRSFVAGDDVPAIDVDEAVAVARPATGA